MWVYCQHLVDDLLLFILQLPLTESDIQPQFLEIVKDPFPDGVSEAGSCLSLVRHKCLSWFIWRDEPGTIRMRNVPVCPRGHGRWNLEHGCVKYEKNEQCSSTAREN